MLHLWNIGARHWFRVNGCFILFVQCIQVALSLTSGFLILLWQFMVIRIIFFPYVWCVIFFLCDFNVLYSFYNFYSEVIIMVFFLVLFLFNIQLYIYIILGFCTLYIQLFLHPISSFLWDLIIPMLNPLILFYWLPRIQIFTYFSV